MSMYNLKFGVHLVLYMLLGMLLGTVFSAVLAKDTFDSALLSISNWGEDCNLVPCVPQLGEV